MVLMGGWSAEREVSLSTGAGVSAALAECGYLVTPVDVTRDLRALLDALAQRPQVVFNALHGRGGEDGFIQGLLDTLDLPYTHSGALASAIAMDKPATKRLLVPAGVPSPAGVVVARGQIAGGIGITPPFVVKPVNEGSSVGVRIVASASEASGLEGDPGEIVLVEQYIPGRDLFVSVLGDRALGVTEVRAHGGFYDFDAKYVDGLPEYLLPAPVPVAVSDAAMALSLTVHRKLGCRGLSRSDLRWDDTKPGLEGLYFLEINTQPGMTPLSLAPEQAAHAGIKYAELCAWLVEDARRPEAAG
jgi:D-alanine-D-alanine ligase